MRYPPLLEPLTDSPLGNAHAVGKIRLRVVRLGQPPLQLPGFYVFAHLPAILAGLISNYNSPANTFRRLGDYAFR